MTATCHSAGIITGIGRVSGRECVIVANDATVKGGTYYPLTVKKHLRAQEIARENHLPCIYLVDSGGANLPQQDEVFPDREHFGRIFYNQAHMSAHGHPADRGGDGLLHGGRRLCAGDVGREHHRAQPGHDLPRRPAAGEGRDRRGRQRGGSRRRRCARRTSGVTDHYAQNDRHALGIARRIVGNLNRVKRKPQSCASRAIRRFRPTRSTASIPTDPRKPYDVREVIARIVDGSEFDEFKQLYGTTLVCGFAQSGAIPVGIIANNGILFSEAALKGAHFIELCCQRGIPLVFLQNITGFMVGTKYEAGGIAKDGAKLVTAVATAPVPKIHGHHRRLVRRGQLRHVRPGLFAALPVDVAQCAHLGDGRRAGGHGAGDGAAGRLGGARAARRRGGRSIQGADPRPVRSARATRTMPPRASGTTAISSPAETRLVLAWGSRPR